MHHDYGLQRIVNGRAYDQVIPNFFDASQFSVPKKPTKDYLLFMAGSSRARGRTSRSTSRKRVGMPLLVAGYGVTRSAEGLIETRRAPPRGRRPLRRRGGFEERNELMGNAAAVIVPTLYIEPFGGVAVEAMLAGAR